MSTDIEPNICRQRIILEGHYDRDFDGDVMKAHLTQLSKQIDMRIFAGPFCYPDI